MLRQHADAAPFELAKVQVAIDAAQARARLLSRSLGAQSADAEDFRQAILLDLIRRSGHFDAERGPWPAFVCIVTHHAATRIAKHRGRAAALITSLPPDHQLTDDKHRVSAADLAIDLKGAVERLPPHLQRLVAVIADTGNLACARRASAVSPASFYRALRHLRLRFIAEGFAPGSGSDLGRIADRIGRSLT